MCQAACGNAFQHGFRDGLHHLGLWAVLDLTDEGPKRTNTLGDTKKELRNGTLIDIIILILVEMRFRNLG